MGAGAASESAVAHYERAELPHTLPCHKLIFNELWERLAFPSLTMHTSYTFYSICRELSQTFFIFISASTDSPSIHSPRFIQAYLSFCCLLASSTTLPSPPLSYLLLLLSLSLLVLFWRREERTDGSSKGCFSNYVI